MSRKGLYKQTTFFRSNFSYQAILTVFLSLIFATTVLAQNPLYVVNNVSSCFPEDYLGDQFFAPSEYRLFSNQDEAQQWFLNIRESKYRNSDNFHIGAAATRFENRNWLYSYIYFKDSDEYYYGVWPANPFCVKLWTKTSIRVTLDLIDIKDAQVSLFSSDGKDLEQSKNTDDKGQVSFALKEGSYKFRIDHTDNQYWSELVHILPDGQTNVNLALDKLALNNTNKPAPERFDGTPPQKEPYMLASLLDFTGILSQSVVAATGPDKIYWYINDHLGTPQKIVDENQQVVWEATQEPFGDLSITNASFNNPFRFPGQIFDVESGLHYNYYRYYDPSIGRYITPDPIGLAGMDPNLYGYALNDPINLIDPTGEFAFAVPAIIWGLKYTAGMALADLTIAATIGITANQAFQATRHQNNSASSPNMASGGNCPNGPDDEDETLQSRGQKITKRTADHFGKNKREVGRALEALKREHGLRSDFHQMRIMKSGNVVDKNTSQIIDNLLNYMN